MLLEHYCHRCDGTSEPGLHHAGPHVKMVCGCCGAYIKFLSPKLIPTIKVIRAAIWETAQHDQRLINGVKAILKTDAVVYNVNVTVHQLQVAWLAVYKNIFDTCNSSMIK